MQNTLSGTILIVDDDAGMRGLLEVVLEAAGLQTLTAPDGDTAVRTLSENRADVRACLLDLNLEDCLGEELYDRLIAVSPQLPVFPISGCFGDEIRERFGNRKIAGIITKPFLTRQLLDTLSAGLRSGSEA